MKCSSDLTRTRGRYWRLTGQEFLAANSFKTVSDLRLLARLVSREALKLNYGHYLKTVTAIRKQCTVCNSVVPGNTLTTYTTKRCYTINYQLNCNSNNVVYLTTCKVCGFQ